MPIFEFEGKTPTVHETAFVAPTATLVGDVVVEENASVWYGAVIRADLERITVRAGANIQDGSVLHADGGTPCVIGPGATVAHLCLVHGADIGEEALIGNHSTVLDGATIGARSLLAAGSLVTPGTEIPEGVLALGSPARVKGPIAGTNAETWVALNPGGYRDLAQRHRAGTREL